MKTPFLFPYPGFFCGNKKPQKNANDVFIGVVFLYRRNYRRFRIIRIKSLRKNLWIKM